MFDLVRTYQTSRLRCLASGSLVICAACLGCASEEQLSTYPAVIEVNYSNGKSIEGAIVTFRSVEHPEIFARGKADADGVARLTTYEVGDGAVLGKHQAVVAASIPKGDLDEVQVTPIAPKYNSYATSGLEFTVTEIEADNKFTLTVTPE